MTKQIYVPVADNGSGAIRANYMVSLIKAIAESGLNIRLARATDSLATRAMNFVSNEFLRSNADELLIIDCDICITGEQLKRLFEHDAPLVYGMYPKRQPKLEMCFAPHRTGEFQPNNGLLEVRRAGRGCVRIARSVFEAMKEDNGGPALRFHNLGRVDWDFWPSGVVDHKSKMAVGCSIEDPTDPDGFSMVDEDGYPRREFISEDWYFCERARLLGIPSLIDTRIMTQHEGDCLFPIHYTAEMLPEILGCFDEATLQKAIREVHARTAGLPELSGEREAGAAQEMSSLT